MGNDYIKQGDLNHFLEDAEKALAQGDEEQLCQLAKKLRQRKSSSNKAYLAVAKEFRAAIKNAKCDESHKSALKELFMLHTVNEFESDQYADIYTLRFPVMQAASLEAEFVRRRRMKQIGKVPDRFLVRSKRDGELFATMAGVKCPASTYDVTFDQIPHERDIVIKPTTGSGAKGVFIVRDLDDIYSVETHDILHSWEELRNEIQRLINAGRVHADSFEYQQCIYYDNETRTPAHDLKFYSFYGEIAAILEIARYPEKAYWWWTPDGTQIDIGVTNPPDMQPCGFTQEMLNEAIRLSLEIPSPYMRLDFLRSEDSMYFDEFCSRSGGQGAIVLEQHFPNYDKQMGNMYLKAETRIINDLLSGKQFEAVNEFNRICETQHI